MSAPDSTFATDLGETRKIFHGQPNGRAVRNLDDLGEVYALALEIAHGTSRRASLLSLDEMKAVAVLAAGAGAVMSHALRLVAASDAGASKEELTERLQTLCNATRGLTQKGNLQ